MFLVLAVDSLELRRELKILENDQYLAELAMTKKDIDDGVVEELLEPAAAEGDVEASLCS